MSPLYDYRCEKCDDVIEKQVPYDARDGDLSHPDPECNGALKRLFINAPKARELTRYGGMKAVVTRGEDGPVVGRVKGHFGKSAKLKKK